MLIRSLTTLPIPIVRYSCFSFCINRTWSMASSIRQCKGVFPLLRKYEQIQEDMTPRIYGIFCRRMAYFCFKSRFNPVNNQQREIFKDFVLNLLNIDIRLLSPTDSINVLYFITVSQKYIQHLDIESSTMITDFVIKNIAYLSKHVKRLNFNRLCEALEQKRKSEQIFQIEAPFDMAQFMQTCLKEYPKTMYLQIDSIFHIFHLFRNITNLPKQQRSIELFIKLCESIKNICPYFDFFYNFKIIDHVISNLGNLIENKQQRKVIVEVLQYLLVNLGLQFQEDGDEQYWKEEVMNQLHLGVKYLKKILGQRVVGDEVVEQIRIKLATSLNLISKKNKKILITNITENEMDSIHQSQAN